jgi:hypothetical protein
MSNVKKKPQPNAKPPHLASQFPRSALGPLPPAANTLPTPSHFKSTHHRLSAELQGVSPNPPILPSRSLLRPAHHEPEGTALSTFFDSGKSLPITVTIDTGMYGNLAETSLFQEKLCMHFEMSLYVIRGKMDHGATYHIPLCSSTYFSIIHNPTDNMKQAMLGHYYETAGHILAQPPRTRPKVVCATQSFIGHNFESSVTAGDILLLSSKVHTRTFKQGKFLKCINVATSETKLLHENCIGCFTTQPDRLKMHLNAFWNNRYCPPPLRVIMYHSLPQVVLPQNIPMTLIAGVWEECIIATHEMVPAGNAEPVYDNTSVHTIRIMKDVGITIISEDGNNQEGLYDGTLSLYNTFNLAKINQHLFCDDPVWPNFEEVQSALYSNVLTDACQEYVLKKPENFSKTFKRQKTIKQQSITKQSTISTTSSAAPVTSTQSKSVNATNNPDYSEVKLEVSKNSSSDLYATLTPVDIKGTTKGDDDEGMFLVHDGVEVIPDVARLLHEVNTANRQMMIHVESLRAEIEGLKLDLRQTKSIMSSMKREMVDMIGRLDAEVLNIKDNMENSGQLTLSGLEYENKEILKSFTTQQLLLAMDLLSLEKYKDFIKTRRVTGVELSNYSERTLVDNMGMTDEADKIRMTLFIQGQQSVWKLLEQQSE